MAEPLTSREARLFAALEARPDLVEASEPFDPRAFRLAVAFTLLLDLAVAAGAWWLIFS